MKQDNIPPPNPRVMGMYICIIIHTDMPVLNISAVEIQSSKKFVCSVVNYTNDIMHTL